MDSPHLIAPEPERFDLEAAQEPVQWVADGLLEAGTVCVLSGDTSAGKSQVALALTAAILGGTRWLGQSVKQGRVVYVDGENSRRIVADRLRAFGVPNEDLEGLRYYLRAGVLLGDPWWDRWLLDVATDHHANLVVIDTASSVVGADPNSNHDVCALYRDALRPLARLGALVLLLCHERKTHDGQRGSGSQATMGARAWAHQADAHITMRATGELKDEATDGGRTAQRWPIELEFPKTRDGVAQARTLRWALVSERSADYRLIWQRIEPDLSPDRREAADADRDADVVDVIASHGEAMRKAEIAEALNLKPRDGSLGRTLRRLVESGVLVQPEHGVYQQAK